MVSVPRAASRAIVVVPTYNERENLERIIGGVRSSAPSCSILIVDDNSPDGTGAIADALSASDGMVNVLHRAGKSGLGNAYRAGMSWALERGYDIVFEMDADGSHPSDQIEPMISATEQADLVIGSRWVAGGAVVNWPRRRLVISRLGSWYARLALGLYVKDATGGFRAYRASTLADVLDDARVSQGYAFQLDMLRNTALKGYSIVEVPITFVERTHGASKMTASIVLEAMALVTWWAIESLPQRLRHRRWHTQVRHRIPGRPTGYALEDCA